MPPRVRFVEENEEYSSAYSGPLPEQASTSSSLLRPVQPSRSSSSRSSATSAQRQSSRSHSSASHSSSTSRPGTDTATLSAYPSSSSSGTSVASPRSRATPSPRSIPPTPQLHSTPLPLVEPELAPASHSALVEYHIIDLLSEHEANYNLLVSPKTLPAAKRGLSVTVPPITRMIIDSVYFSNPITIEAEADLGFVTVGNVLDKIYHHFWHLINLIHLRQLSGMDLDDNQRQLVESIPKGKVRVRGMFAADDHGTLWRVEFEQIEC
ncbi:hypothetical protein AMATHDRAFT_5223 [Amanita thiersii Skay4041]|uniref:DUF6699 domain-containing protein n=1 Tax=Amanita thiersii Skay4041 TaxID=703135 RepID=A0A2A9NLD8_9AGAR|nr:hypothetical protein AMATHDRAFT_5223 [Amanita thiersii Skay4041]